MKTLSILVLCLYTLVFDTNAKTDSIPYFSFKNNVILDGFINDSIPTKALLDIGAWGISIPEKYRTKSHISNGNTTESDENVRFSIGNWSRNMTTSYMKDDSQFLHWYGQDCVLLGWDFFEDKILEISYKDHFIRELSRNRLDSLSGYDCIKFTDRGRRLIIPASIHIDGKIIAGNFWIDTGLNGTLFFTNNVPHDYNINLSKTIAGKAKNMDTKHTPINIIKTDTIRIGDCVLKDRDIIFPDSEWFVFKKNDIYIGLIGNQFFKEFSVIFDFEKNNMYLKPLEE